MTDHYNYEIYARGNKKAVLFFFGTMPSSGEKHIIQEKGNENDYCVLIKGACDCEPNKRRQKKKRININLNSLTEDEIRDMSILQRSLILDIEILIHSWSVESASESYDHYKSGQELDWNEEAYPVPEELSDIEAFPLWDKNEFELYEDFCDAVFDSSNLSIYDIPENDWIQDEEGLYCLNGDTWSDFREKYMEDFCHISELEAEFRNSLTHVEPMAKQKTAMANFIEIQEPSTKTKGTFFCDYEVKVKGTKRSAFWIYYTMPEMGYKKIKRKSGSEESYELLFMGDCELDCDPRTNDGDVNKYKALTDIDEEEMDCISEEYCNFELRAKSEALECEIFVRYYSEKSRFDRFEHYKNGKCPEKQEIKYHSDNKFNWNKMDYVKHSRR